MSTIPMANLVDGTRLGDEPVDELAIRRERRKQHLHRDPLADQRLSALVDDSHPPDAEPRDDLVLTDLVAGEIRRLWGGFRQVARMLTQEPLAPSQMAHKLLPRDSL